MLAGSHSCGSPRTRREAPRHVRTCDAATPNESHRCGAFSLSRTPRAIPARAVREGLAPRRGARTMDEWPSPCRRRGLAHVASVRSRCWRRRVTDHLGRSECCVVTRPAGPPRDSTPSPPPTSKRDSTNDLARRCRRASATSSPTWTVSANSSPSVCTVLSVTLASTNWSKPVTGIAPRRNSRCAGAAGGVGVPPDGGRGHLAVIHRRDREVALAAPQSPQHAALVSTDIRTCPLVRLVDYKDYGDIYQARLEVGFTADTTALQTTRRARLSGDCPGCTGW